MHPRVMPFEELAQRGVAYWLPYRGTSNGVPADTWTILLDIETDEAPACLDILAQVGVGAYFAIPNGQQARANTRYPLYVDMQQYHRAEDAMMLFCRGKQPPPQGATKVEMSPRSHVGVATTSQLPIKDTIGKVIWSCAAAASIALGLAAAYYGGPTSYPAVHRPEHPAHQYADYAKPTPKLVLSRDENL
jgi:hypothetical protein